jgi:hypothetical protein
VVRGMTHSSATLMRWNVKPGGDGRDRIPLSGVAVQPALHPAPAGGT